MFHWTIKKDIQLLKKNGNLEGALNLLQQSIEFTENEANTTDRRLYSSPYEDAAIILRKLQRYQEEAELLERFLSHPKAVLEGKYFPIANRLEKSCLLAGHAENISIDGVNKVFYKPENTLFENRSLFIKTGLIVDTETTGLNLDTDELIELGLIVFEYSFFKKSIAKVIETYAGLQEPSIPIPSDSTKIHGLSNKDLRGKKFDHIKITEVFNKADFVIAHNVSFDRNFIEKIQPEAIRKNWYCSMNGIPWRKYGHKSKGLQNLLSDFKIETTNSHRALEDAKAVLDLLLQKNPITYTSFLNELLSGSPEPKEKRLKRNSSKELIINVKVPSIKQKRSLWDIFFKK